MSTVPSAGNGKITVPDILSRKSHPSYFTERKIVSLTAYDTPTARIVDQAGADVILVGDSLAMVVLGYETTLPVTAEEMLHHTRAVRRGVRRAVLVSDNAVNPSLTTTLYGPTLVVCMLAIVSVFAVMPP